MSAELLRQAATILRERAEKATPGPWSAADEHGLIPEAWPAWCVSQMRPGYESMSPEDGYVKDVADVHGDDKDACPDADYIATMHPGVGLALADTLDAMAARAAELTETLPPESAQVLPVLVRNLTGYVSMVALARLIVGGDA